MRASTRMLLRRCGPHGTRCLCERGSWLSCCLDAWSTAKAARRRSRQGLTGADWAAPGILLGPRLLPVCAGALQLGYKGCDYGRLYDPGYAAEAALTHPGMFGQAAVITLLDHRLGNTTRSRRAGSALQGPTQPAQACHDVKVCLVWIHFFEGAFDHEYARSEECTSCIWHCSPSRDGFVALSGGVHSVVGTGSDLRHVERVSGQCDGCAEQGASDASALVCWGG